MAAARQAIPAGAGSPLHVLQTKPAAFEWLDERYVLVVANGVTDRATYADNIIAAETELVAVEAV